MGGGRGTSRKLRGRRTGSALALEREARGWLHTRSCAAKPGHRCSLPGATAAREAGGDCSGRFAPAGRGRARAGDATLRSARTAVLPTATAMCSGDSCATAGSRPLAGRGTATFPFRDTATAGSCDLLTRPAAGAATTGCCMTGDSHKGRKKVGCCCCCGCTCEGDHDLVGISSCKTLGDGALARAAPSAAGAAGCAGAAAINIVAGWPMSQANSVPTIASTAAAVLAAIAAGSTFTSPSRKAPQPTAMPPQTSSPCCSGTV